ncbi:group II intron maturase-specific domain-containing protein [Streptomyces vinaceus]
MHAGAPRRRTSQPRSVTPLSGTPSLHTPAQPGAAGWTAYFWHGVSSATFQYLSAFTWRQVFGWLRRKHRRSNWKSMRRRYCEGRWSPADDEVILFRCAKVRTNRYLYRGNKIPLPWPSGITMAAAVCEGLWRAGCLESGHVRFGRRFGETTGGNTSRAPRADLTRSRRKPGIQHPAACTGC